MEGVVKEYYKEGNTGCTIHSVVYNLTQRTTHFVSSEHYGEEDATFRYQIK